MSKLALVCLLSILLSGSALVLAGAVRAQDDNPATLFLPAVVNGLPATSTVTTTASTTQLTALYAGPSNVDYAPLTTLLTGTILTPTGFYGDFVQVQTADEETVWTGYLWRDAVSNLHSDLPLIDAAAVTPVERVLVPATYPLTYDLFDPNNYRIYPLAGSSTLAARDLTLRLSLGAQAGAAAPAEAANGIFFGTYANRLYLVRQQGEWRFIYGEGDSYPIVHAFPSLTGSTADFTLNLSRKNRLVTVTPAGGTPVQIDLGKSVFASNATLYLFTQTAPASTTTLRAARLAQAPSGAYERILGRAAPLRLLAAQRGITMGTLADGGVMASVLDRQLMERHADLQVWHLGWSFSDPNNALENAYAELSTSSIVAQAKSNGQRVRVHPLLWYLDIPDWVKNGNYRPAELETILRDRITGLMTKHQADEWVVVNEAIVDERTGPDLRTSVFQQAFGEAHIDMAFRMARAADPDAILIYNDYGVETINTKSDRMYGLIQRLLARGVPIDGVGFQFHLLGCEGGEPPTKAQIMANLARFAALGVDLYITELDVNLHGLSSSQAAKWATQAAIYQDVTAACLETPACRSVTTWGLRDGASWWYDVVGCGDDPLLFTNEHLPKPAFFGVEAALQQGPATNLRVGRINSAPTIDGNLDGLWRQVTPQPLTHGLDGRVPSPADFAATFRTLHNGRQLYVLIEVTDPTMRTDSGDQWWEDDALEIYLDGDHSRLSSYDGVNDYQLVFRRQDRTLRLGPNSKAAPARLRWAMVETPTGYRVEVALPLAQVGINQQPGMRFGLDVTAMDDDDGGGRDDKLAWHTTVDENWFNPSHFGLAELAGATLSAQAEE